MIREDLVKLLDALGKTEARDEILRIFDAAAEHGTGFKDAVIFCEKALTEYGVEATKDSQSATTLRSVLEDLNRSGLDNAPKLFISKAHLAVAFLRLGYKPSFSSASTFTVAASCGNVERRIRKALKNPA